MAVDFDNTYVELPDRFYEEQRPTPVDEPELIRANGELAERLGIDPEWLDSRSGAAFVAGNHMPEAAEPIATAYAGHQFGNFVPQLGDGRAHLVGEVVDADGRRFDIQLKGSGRTKFSRRGDGRAPLGPVLREYLVSEAMHGLGIPTTRALGAASTGERVRREEGLVPGAVLARVASSHIRVGTFQYFGARDDAEALGRLTAYARERHYPELESDSPVALFDAVAGRQARLVADWQLVGFIHGVMNTDNMLIAGETIDYGPCAFMNEFDPETVFSSIDRHGRYAYENQPGIAEWNLRRFAHTLAQLGEGDSAIQSELEEIADDFRDRFRARYREGMAEKLGFDQFREEDAALVDELLELMARHDVDFTLTFRRLTELADPSPAADGPRVGDFFSLPPAFDRWLDRWRDRITARDVPGGRIAESMRTANPAIIPRNYQVETAIEDAVEDGDFDSFHRLVDVLDDPFRLTADRRGLAGPPTDGERVKETFCGT